jgi:coenzyme Q-binding protein COQ10
VADVERYPEFLPLCEALVVRTRNTQAGVTTLVADMSVGYKAIRETFRTRVTLDPAQRSIRAEYIDGPFRYLENRWSFEPSGTSTDIEFHITYEFKSVMLGMLAGAVFDRAFRRYAEAFEARARKVYGVAAPAQSAGQAAGPITPPASPLPRRS